MIRALPCVLDTEDHPRRQRSHHVIHCPSEISQQYCSMCCISTNNAFTVRVSSCPLSLPRIYCSSNDIFSVPKLNFNFLDKRPHFFRFFFWTPSLINIIICYIFLLRTFVKFWELVDLLAFSPRPAPLIFTLPRPADFY